MNFSDYCSSMHDPLFTEDKKPTCKSGFVYDKELKKCIPAANAKTTNKENPGQRALPGALGGWMTWGSTGLNGDGYALESDGEAPDSMSEEVVSEMTYSGKQKARIDKQEEDARAQDNRMKYGKTGRPPEKQLRPGEVRKWDKVQGKWVSNK